MEFSNLVGFDPSTCISGKMMRINRITANVFRKYLNPFHITDSQLSILFVLSKMGGLNQKQITDITKLEKSSLHRNLKRLLERGFISRAHFPVMEMTPEGKLFVNNAIPEWQKAMDEIKNRLNEDGSQALDLIHTKLIS